MPPTALGAWVPEVAAAEAAAQHLPAVAEVAAPRQTSATPEEAEA
jgi:hypothetical protein